MRLCGAPAITITGITLIKASQQDLQATAPMTSLQEDKMDVIGMIIVAPIPEVTLITNMISKTGIKSPLLATGELIVWRNVVNQSLAPILTAKIMSFKGMSVKS